MNTKLKHVEHGRGPVARTHNAQSAKETGRIQTPIPVLSRKQSAIVRLVAQGLSDKEIGRTLHLTEGTVGWYLNKIFIKWRVRSRVALTLRFLHEISPKPMTEERHPNERQDCS